MQRFILLLVFLTCCHNLPAQMTAGADDICATWLNPDGTRKMRIYRTGETFEGCIIWRANSSDRVNLNDVILKDLAYQSGKWKGKLVFEGKTYKASLTLSDFNTLRITAEYGFIKKTKEWKRV